MRPKQRGCPTFAPAYVGRKRRGEAPSIRLFVVLLAVPNTHGGLIENLFLISRMKFANATEPNRKSGVA